MEHSPQGFTLAKSSSTYHRNGGKKGKKGEETLFRTCAISNNAFSEGFGDNLPEIMYQNWD
jgi:hypothetical protein